MRILKLFFTSLLILLIVAVVGGLIGREILLSMAVNQIRGAVKEVRSLSIDPTFSQSCLQYGGLPPDAQSLVRTQLRFTSDTEFVLEAVCQSTESLRSTFRTSALPPLVKKGSGQSGFVQGETLHGLTLTALGRTGAVYQDEALVQSSLRYAGDPALTLTAGPATVCAGYGYSCCSDTSQLGQGDLQAQALDCPRSCYASCTEKPVVINFNSENTTDSTLRIISLRSGETAQFDYTVSDIRGNLLGTPLLENGGVVSLGTKLMAMVAQVFHRAVAQDSLEKIVIAFGDNQSQDVSDLQGTVQHTYTCTRALCVYNATIQAVTRAGITSTLTDTSKLQVQVTP